MTAVHGDILDIEGWAAKADYPLARKALEFLSSLPEEYEVADALRIGLDRVQKLRARGLLMADARNVDLVSHIWFEESRGPQNLISQVFFLKSQTGDILGDEPEWLRGMEGLSFVSRFETGGRNCLFDFSGYGEGLHIKEPCAFLGSSNNWGHQICDNLPRLLVLDSLGFPKNGKLVTGILSPMFLQLYEALGISRDRLLVIDHEAKSHAVHRFDHLFVPADPSPDAGYAFLRERIYGRRKTESGLKPGSGNIYFSRRSQAGRGRISNQDEVEAYFQDRGFAVIDPTDLSVLQLLDRLEHARIVAAQFGAALGNQVLAPASSVMLNLFPPLYFSPIVPANVAAYWRSLYIPFLDRCVFALGKPETPDIGPDLLKAMDMPHRYDPRVLDQALKQGLRLAS
ncbi:MAG: glycosyltransferase family 61 protein, partial [Rhodospirillales bacterium]